MSTFSSLLPPVFTSLLPRKLRREKNIHNWLLSISDFIEGGEKEGGGELKGFRRSPSYVFQHGLRGKKRKSGWAG